MPAMLTRERFDVIRGRLDAEGKVVARDLAREFGVSEDTVRRDLRELARQGLCRRVYGGALLDAPPAGRIETRSGAHAEEKDRLAAEAVKLVERGQTLFVDAGSTNAAVARALPDGLGLTIVTNAPAVALALAAHADTRVLLLGGLFDGSRGATLGGETSRRIAEINADLCFLGSCGVDARIGATAFDAGEAEVKRAMVAQSAEVAVVATADKLGTAAPFTIARAGEISHLVVGDSVDADKLDRFRANGIEVHSANIDFSSGAVAKQKNGTRSGG